MNDILTLIIGGLIGYVGQILVARYSKSRRERDVEIAKEYLSLAGITADELEKRINLIAKLDDDNRALQNEIYLLKQRQSTAEEKRKERDAQIEGLEAHVAGLQAQIDKDTRERADLRAKLAEFDTRYRALYRYLLALLEQMRRHDITPVDPPGELKSDPEILKFFGKDAK